MDWNLWTPIIGWAIALVVFAVVEGMTVGLTSLWFAVGALCALITAAFTRDLTIQVIVFLAVSLAALLLLRPMAKRQLRTRQAATNADRAIGCEAVVTEDIDNLAGRGSAAVKGTPWTARADGDERISAGTTVRVLRIEGAKVIVTPIHKPSAVGAGKI